MEECSSVVYMVTHHRWREAKAEKRNKKERNSLAPQGGGAKQRGVGKQMKSCCSENV